MEGLNYSMLNQIKLWCCLFLMALNHSITDAVLFPLVEFGCSRDFAVDSVEDCFAYSAYLGFGGVN